MAARTSSPSEGDVNGILKAKHFSQPDDQSVNGLDRIPLGLDGASDFYASNHRAPSRSPSPFRRKRTVSRSPSPYRRGRDAARSPSPFRHGRDARGQDGGDPKFHNKRKASPLRGGRSDKRQYNERNKHNHRDSRTWSRAEDARAPPFNNNGKDKQHPKPISYAEVEKPNAIPNFTNGISADHPRHHFNENRKRNGNGPKPNSDVAALKPSESVDVEMRSADDEPEYTLVPVGDQEPTQESREEKKRRWAALRAAAAEKAKKDNLLQQALTNASESTTVSSPRPGLENSVSPSASPRLGHLESGPGSPDVMIIDKQQAEVSEGNSPSAADYDPTKDDGRDRAALQAQQHEVPSDAYKETDSKVLSTLPAQKVLPVKKQKKEVDMFAEDEEYDDGEAEDEDANAEKGTVLDANLISNWDDPEGYYKLINHELMHGGQYRIIKSLGRGVFANVAQAEDVGADGNDKSRKLVAIKIIRRNEMMRTSSLKEMDFLRKANEADPQDKRHIVRVLSSFDHKGHLCIVFEHMSKNLRDLLKEETNGHGIALSAVRTYSRQMFLGLKHLQDCQILHLDLKPDNILVSLDKKTVKLCDFGTASDKRDIIEHTGYHVSRFYRPPEVILGMEYGYGIDMWAIGCTMYELWTGKILFTGNSNNQMIKAFMDCLGWPSEKLLRKGLANKVLEHFEIGPPLKFISKETDQHNKPFIRKIQQQKKIDRDLKTRVHDAARAIAQGGPTTVELNDFVDLLSATLNMNLEKRIQAKDALVHKFLVNKNQLSRSTVLKPTNVRRGTPGASGAASFTRR